MHLPSYAVIILSGFVGMLIGAVLTLACVPLITPIPIAAFLRRCFGLPSFTPPDDWKSIDDTVNTITGIEYDDGDAGLVMDEHWRNGTRPDDNPCIIWVHGGGFVGGSRTSTTGFCMMLASRGYTVFNIEYGLAPRYHHPRQVLDLDNALNALRSMPASKRPDMSKGVFVGGDSAGAHIVAEYAALRTNPEYANELGVLLTADVRINGCILLCGLYDFTAFLHSSWWRFPVRFFVKHIGWAITGNRKWFASNQIRRMDITANITSDYPPAFLADGNRFTFDNQLPVMDKLLSCKHVDHEVMSFPRGNGHGKLYHEFQFDFRKPESMQVLEGIDAFMREHA